MTTWSRVALVVALAGCRPSCAKSVECRLRGLRPVVYTTREVRCFYDLVPVECVWFDVEELEACM